MLEIPFLSRALCDLTMLPLSGNPFHPSFNTYDIRRECVWQSDDCYPADGLNFYLGSRKFKSQLVGAPLGPWEKCSDSVFYSLFANTQYSYGYYLKDSLDEGLPVLIYNGDKDFMFNWRGAEAWTEALVWDHQEEFNQQTFKNWTSS